MSENSASSIKTLTLPIESQDEARWRWGEGEIRTPSAKGIE
jgi:hypothetical protein